MRGSVSGPGSIASPGAGFRTACAIGGCNRSVGAGPCACPPKVLSWSVAKDLRVGRKMLFFVSREVILLSHFRDSNLKHALGRHTLIASSMFLAETEKAHTLRAP